MTQSLFFFYFAGVTIISSILTIGLRSPVYCTLALLSTLLHVAGLFILLHAEFVAAIQIIVYAGAVLVLYLFVLMLLDLKTTENFLKHTWVALFFGVVIFVQILLGLFKSSIMTTQPREIAEAVSVPAIGNTEAIGLSLFNEYLLPFEMVGVILLGAAVGAMVLAKKIPAR